MQRTESTKIKKKKQKHLDAVVHIRMTAAEKAQWEANAARCGMKISTYGRMLIKNSNPKPAPPLDYQHMINQLNQINMSMHNIAVAAQRSGDVNAATYNTIVRQFRDIVLKIMQTITVD